MENQAFEGNDLRETIGILMRRKLIIGVSVVAVTGASLAMSMSATPTYCSSARVVVRPVIPAAAMPNSGYSVAGPLGLETSADSEAEIAGSQLVGAEVAKTLGIPAGAVLPASISVRVLTEQLLGFTSCSTDKAQAANVANTYAAEYLNYRRGTAEKALRELAATYAKQGEALSREIAGFDERIARLNQQAVDPARRAGAVAEINLLQSQRNEALFRLSTVRTRYQDAQNGLGSSTGGGQIVQPAAIASSPSSPKPARDGVLGLILGALLGIGIAFVRQHFDDKIRDLSDASRRVGLLVMGVIPRSKSWKNQQEVRLESIDEPGAPVAEAYRSLRQGLQKMGLGSDYSTLLVTSGRPGAGKSTSTANLGVAIARTGKKVVLVSADLRKPRLHEFFGLRNEAGLSEILAGKVELTAIAPTAIANLWVLPSGAVPSNPSDLLDSTRLAEVLDKIKAVADVVIIDGPPMVAGADAMVLARHADQTMLLLHQQKARTGEAVAVRDELMKGGARMIVSALTMAEFNAKKSGYGYGYGYGYGERPADPVAIEVSSNGNGNGHHAPMALAPVTVEELVPVAAAAVSNGNGNGNGNGHKPTVARKRTSTPSKAPRRRATPKTDKE
jgi:capsular exopolysaccharide synthesis family protein